MKTQPPAQPPTYWIQTAFGRAFDFEHITPESVDLVEIAWSLSNLCRYNGHTRRFYSVAEHSVRLSRWHKHPELARASLFHDAHEAYTGDLTTPLQRYLWYDAQTSESALRLQSIRDRVDTIVAEKAGTTLALLGAVAQSDHRIVINERAALHSEPPFPWCRPGESEPTPLDLNQKIKGWKPTKAFRKFLERMRQLGLHVEVPAGASW